MNLLDVVLGLVLVAAAIGGWQLGFLRRALSWVGLFGGLALAVFGIRLLVEPLSSMDTTLALTLSLVAIFVGSFSGQAIGLWVGSAIARRGEGDPVHHRLVDGPAGALVGMLGVASLVWLLIPAASGLSGTPGRMVRESALVQAIDNRMPDPPDAVQALRSFVGGGAFPAVFESLGPTAPAGPPPATAGIEQEVVDAVARSVVRVEGTACNRLQHGTGWVAAPELVVTNAHVVAGETTTEVVRDDGTHLPALVVAFDERQDLAVLSVPGIARDPLPIHDVEVGTTTGVFGHPGGGDLRLAPATVSRRLQAVGRDIYGRSGAEREVLELATRLAPGDSGAPLAGSDGAAVGVVFAVATDRDDVAYALSVTEVRAVLAGVGDEVSTGSCVG